jgi:hypothetical protein
MREAPPDFTQEVAPNESQRDPKPLTSEALIYEALFVLVSRLMWKLGGSLPVFIEAVHSIPLDTLSAR